MKYGLNMLLWTTSVDETHYALLEKIKGWGYDGVELPIFDLDVSKFKKLGEKLDALGLERTAVTVSTPEANPISDSAPVRQAAVDRLKKVVEICQACGVEKICGPLHSALGQFSGTGPTADEWKWGKETLATVAEINARFGRAGWQPVVLIPEQQEPARVFEFYRAADFCIVNSLHDGMNLVAKEFVAARDDEDGVLILSTFAGASRELVEALLVNPFDANETAAAIEIALHMTREERRERMRLLRRTVKHNNVFRWAGRMLVDAAQIRQRQRLAKHALARRPRTPRIRHG